jgi:hypothetical protein
MFWFLGLEKGNPDESLKSLYDRRNAGNKGDPAETSARAV